MLICKGIVDVPDTIREELLTFKKELLQDRSHNDEKIDKLIGATHELTVTVAKSIERDKLYEHQIETQEKNLSNIDKKVVALQVDVGRLTEKVDNNTKSSMKWSDGAAKILLTIVSAAIIGGLVYIKS